MPRVLPNFALYPLGLLSLAIFLRHGDMAALTTALITLLLPLITLGGIYASRQTQLWLTESTLLVPSGLRGRPMPADLREVIAVGLVFVERRPAGWRLFLWRSNGTVWRVQTCLRASRATHGMTHDATANLAVHLAESGLGQAAIQIRNQAIALQGPDSQVATNAPFLNGLVPAIHGSWSAADQSAISFAIPGTPHATTATTIGNPTSP